MALHTVTVLSEYLTDCSIRLSWKKFCIFEGGVSPVSSTGLFILIQRSVQFLYQTIHYSNKTLYTKIMAPNTTVGYQTFAIQIASIKQFAQT